MAAEPAPSGRTVPPVPALAATAAITAVALLFANTDVGPEEEGGVGAFIAGTIISVAVAAILLLVVVPRARGSAEGQARLSLLLGAVALLTVLVFWSGLPFGIGMPALVAALEARRAGMRRNTRATAGAILGAVAITAAAAACIVG